MKHAYTRRSNASSKVQANMHTSLNSQCNPDMQCISTWTMDTSHDCKSNTKRIIIKKFFKWVLLEGLGEQVGFQLWLKWGVCVWRMEKADYSRLRDPERRKISGLSISFWTEGSSVYVCLWQTVKYRMACRFVKGQRGIKGWRQWRSCNTCRTVCMLYSQRLVTNVVIWGVV